MSIVLLNAEIENIRSHEKINFSPSPSDLTVISGPNGTGKSTIPNSVAWALFGTKPEGVSSNSSFIRHGVKPGKDIKVRTKVRLQVDDSIIVVERRIVSKTGSAECDMWEEKEDGTLEHLSGPAVSHTEKAIVQRLRMDEKGFLAAILVQQKQVDALISAPPRERGKIIEKLTGISMLTTALESARSEYNELKKTASKSSFDPDALAGAEQNLADVSEEIQKVNTDLETAKQTASAAQQSLSTAQQELDTAQGAYDASEERRQRITSLSSSVKVEEKHFVDAVAEREEAKKRLPKEYSPESLRDAQEKLSTAQDTYHRAANTVREANRRVKALQSKKESLQSRLDELGTTVGSVEDTQSRRDKAQSKVESLTQSREDGMLSVSALGATLKSLKSAIQTLEGHEGK
jgi:exonuclease SbcC